MQFTNPTFLWALLAIAIPILIHLFNFRRFKKVYFPDIRFLKEVKQQTQSQNRLRHLLVLASRILAISALVLAFAQPYFPAEGQKTRAGGQAIGVYIDNSFSMENVGRNGILFEEAKRMAREIALAFSATDRFMLLTNDFEEKHQKLVSRDEFMELLEEISITPSVRTVSSVVSRQNDVLLRSDLPVRRSYLLSDFQNSIADWSNVKTDTSILTVLLPLEANKPDNLYIDSCWFESPVHQPGQPEKIIVRIVNSSANALENVPAKLFLNGQQRTPASFSIGANETRELELAYTLQDAGIQNGWVEIADHPVTYDDKFYFSFKAEEQIPVTCISSSGLTENSSGLRAIRSLYENDSLFRFTRQEETKVDYASLAQQQLIILLELKSISTGLGQELQRFTSQGGSVVVFPPAEIDTMTYRAFLSSVRVNHYLRKDSARTRTNFINRESRIFSDVFESNDKEANLDLPFVLNHYITSGMTRTGEEILLRLQNGRPLFSAFPADKGKIYLSAVPLNEEWSNLARHAIFVPLMYQAAIQSQPTAPLFYTIGEDPSIPVQSRAGGENLFRVRSDSGSSNRSTVEIVPESRPTGSETFLFLHDQIREAGNYLLTSGQERIKGLSFNYDRRESDLSCQNPDQISGWLEQEQLNNFSMIDAGGKNMTYLLADMSQGKKLWKWFILAALLFFAIEILLLRFRSFKPSN